MQLSPEVLTFVQIIALLLFAVAVRMYIKVKKAELSLADQQLLDVIAGRAVSSAEELGKRQDWTGAVKLSHAQQVVKDVFKAIENSGLETALHAAMNERDLGASSSAKTAPTDKPVASE